MVLSSFLIPGSIRKKERKKERLKEERVDKGEQSDVEKNVKACKGKRKE